MAQEEAAARRYARGLAECAEEKGTFAEAASDFVHAAALLDPKVEESYSAELAGMLSSPTVGAVEKERTLDAVLSRLNVDPDARGLFTLLARRGRLALAPKIAMALEEFSGAAAGGRVAVVHSARPLSPEQEKALAEAVSTALGAPARLRVIVDAGLLAGAKVTVGDWTVDGTVSGRLEDMRRRLVDRADAATEEAERRKAGGGEAPSHSKDTPS